MRKGWFAGAIAVLLPAAVLLSCGGGGGSGEEKQDAMAEGTDEVVAVVDGEEVTRASVDAEVARLFKQFGGQVSPFQAAQMESLLTVQARDNLINKIVLGGAVENEGDRLDETEVQARFDEFMTQFPDTAAFRQAILSQGWETEEAFFEEFRRMMEIDALLEEHTSDYPPPTEQEIEGFYAENKERFRQEEQINARHILRMFSEGDDDASKAEKRREIESILDRIRKGADFAALAQEHSDCPSKANGGDLGWFGRNRMVQPFEEVAFSLPEGTVSDVVETRFGYHIIEVIGRREGKLLSLEEVRGGIEEQLNQQHRREKIDEYLNGLREQAKITYPATSPPEKPAVVDAPPPIQ